MSVTHGTQINARAAPNKLTKVIQRQVIGNKNNKHKVPPKPFIT